MSSTARAARVERARRSTRLAIATGSLVVAGLLGWVAVGLAGDDGGDVIVTDATPPTVPTERPGISADTDDTDDERDGTDTDHQDDTDTRDDGPDDRPGTHEAVDPDGGRSDNTDDGGDGGDGGTDGSGGNVEPAPATENRSASEPARRTRSTKPEPRPVNAAASPPGADQPAAPASGRPPTLRNDDRLPEWASVPERVVDVPDSIDASGGADVTAALNQFLASAPDNSVIRFPADARYRVEDRVVIGGRRNLLIDGNGSTLFAATVGHKNRSHLRIEGSSNVTVRDLVVRGGNPDAGMGGKFQVTLEHQHGIDVRHSNHVAILGVTVTDVFGDFVYLGRSATTVPWTSRVEIRDSTFRRSGRQGVAMTAARDILIEDNRFDDMRRSTFDFEPEGDSSNDFGNAHEVEDVTIRGNRIGRGQLNFVAAAGRGRIDDIVIEDNILSGQAMQIFAPRKNGRSNWRVENNRSDLPINTPHGSVMRFEGIDSLVVRGNVQPVKGAGMVGVETTDSCDVRVSRNTFASAVSEHRSVGSSC